MSDKNSHINFFQAAFPYIVTMLLSIWGGVVNYIQQLKKGKRFKMTDLICDLFVSTFAGLLTYNFCLYSKVDPAISAILIAISGHMGTRAIPRFENIYYSIFETKEKK